MVNIARCPVHGLHGCRTTCFAFEHEGERDCRAGGEGRAAGRRPRSRAGDGRVEQVPMVPVAALREWIAQRRAWTAIAGAMEMLEEMLDGAELDVEPVP